MKLSSGPSLGYRCARCTTLPKQESNTPLPPECITSFVATLKAEDPGTSKAHIIAQFILIVMQEH